MSEHTAGPWKWACNSFYPDNADCDQASVGKIAPWGGFYIAHISADVPHDQRAANACLIAAAPDLLKALETALPSLRDLVSMHSDVIPQEVKDQDNKVLTIVEAAIAKARTNPEGVGMGDYRVTVRDRRSEWNQLWLANILAGTTHFEQFNQQMETWNTPPFYRFWRWWFRVVRRMTFHRYLIHTRKFGLGD